MTGSMKLNAMLFRQPNMSVFTASSGLQAVASRPAANAPGAPSKETDKQIRALRTELALLKRRLEEMPMQLILPPADGDFAILASRPIMGYK